MVKRKIIKIDRDKCNGCGLCTTACAEGALVLDEEKKVVLVKEIYCDGMGACLDVCPTGALTIEERDSAEYDPKAVYNHVLKTQGESAAKKVHGAHEPLADIRVQGKPEEKMEKSNKKPPLPCGCPGTMAKELKPKKSVKSADAQGNVSSELSQWPIQLHLVSPLAPYFDKCDLLIAADCTAFTLGSFHQDLLKGKKLVIACPKLDETSSYVEKISELLKNNTIYSLTVVRMVVPCCAGLTNIVESAIEKSGTNIKAKEVIIDLEGNIVN